MEIYDISKLIKLPVGMHKLNDDPGISFQLNRFVNMDGCDLSVAQEIGPGIKTAADFYGVRPLMNMVFRKKARKEPVIDWGLKHGQYAYEAKYAYGYAKRLKLYDIGPIADKITQDMLIVGANQDHFIDYRMVGRETNMLKNVRSLTFRLFADKEDAQNHCNVGNGKLVLDFICNWISQVDGGEIQH